MAFPLSEHQAIYDLVDVRTSQILAEILTSRSQAMATAADLAAAVNRLETAVQEEKDQLAAALQNATTLAELQAAVDATVTRLGTISTGLEADDAPATPPTVPIEPGHAP